LFDGLFRGTFAEDDSFCRTPNAASTGRLAGGGRDLSGFDQLLQVTQALTHHLLRAETVPLEADRGGAVKEREPNPPD